MKKSSKILVAIGCVLVAISIGLFVFWQVSCVSAQKLSQKITSQINGIFPTTVVGVKEEVSTLEMPVLQMYDKDIVALVKIPAHDVELPIENEYRKTLGGSLPMRFSGSAYDGSLKVYASDTDWQFSCVNNLQIGDKISVVDMSGAEFSYTVKDFARKNSLSDDVTAQNCNFTLIVKEEFSFDYIYVFCE